MPRPRTPTAKAELTGAAAKDPQRYRVRFKPESEQPVGEPPEFLNDAEKKAWSDFAARWSWLTASDEPALVALVQLRAMIEDPDTPKNAALYTTYRLAIGEFGGTPVSRSKVSPPGGDDDDDPFAAFGVQ